MMRTYSMILVVILATGLLASGMIQQGFSVTTYIQVDPTNIPYQITCDPTADVYMSMYNDGEIAKVSKDSKAVTIYQANDGQKIGSNFYSIDYDPNSRRVFVNEQSTGLLWQYAVDTNTWFAFPLVEEISESPKIIYRNGYHNAPLKISVDENPSDHHLHAYTGNTGVFEQVLVKDGIVWTALSYHLDFDAFAETNAGVTDLNFAGIAKFNPDSLDLRRIALPRATETSGLAADPSDSDILWVANRGPNTELYKFDTATETVIETIDLKGNYNPHNLAVDANYVYVPLGVSRDFENEQNSMIMRVDKATKETLLIDTGAWNSDEGTFSIFLDEATNTLHWTDNSHHVGSIDLEKGSKLWQDNRLSINNNYFGCKVGSEFWWAAHASADIGISELEATSFALDVSGKVKKEGGTTTRDVTVQIEGDYSCDENMRIKPVVGSLSATLTMTGNNGGSRTVTKVTLQQVDDFGLKYNVNAGSWGKLSGKTMFGTIQDCHNDIDLFKTTKKNTMTLTKVESGVAVKYKVINTTDIGKVTYVE
jgi:hypothetical protein